MASDSSLVPQGLPYGERKEMVEARQAGGVPTSVSPPSVAAPQVPQTRSLRPPDMLRAVAPREQVSLESVLSPPPVDPKVKLRDIRDRSRNVVARELLSRLIGE